MSDNPYRFTVKVIPPDKHYSDKWWDVVLADNDGTLILLDSVMRAEVRGFSDGVAVSVNGHSTKQAGPLLLMLEAVE